MVILVEMVEGTTIRNHIGRVGGRACIRLSENNEHNDFLHIPLNVCVILFSNLNFNTTITIYISLICLYYDYLDREI